MFTINITGNIKEYDNRKQVHMLARAYEEVSKTLKQALHAIEGSDGAIVINTIPVADGVTIDGITAAKIKEAQELERAQQQAEMDAIHAQQAANLEARIAAEQAAALAFEAKINELVDAKLAAAGIGGK